MKNIDITMIGPSTSGKTCFLLGMYATMREGVRGFTFSSEDPDQDLDLSSRWENMVDEKGEQRWPRPNDNNVFTYHFRFNYAFSKILGFSWIDYRGGALGDRATEADVQELKQHVRNSGCLLLCISGEHLASNKVGRIKTDGQIARINQFLAELNDIAARPPVAIVVTKYDYCEHLDEESLAHLMREVFSPLFAEDSGWLVSICPVSLGPSLAKDPDEGEIAPQNMHLPIVFAIFSSLRCQLDQLSGQLRQAEARHASLSRNFISRLFNSDEIQLNLEAQETTRKSRDRIEKQLTLLIGELEGATKVYYSGEEVEYDG